MLRASSSAGESEAANLQALVSGDVDSGVVAQSELLDLVEATLLPDERGRLAGARDAVAATLGDAALIDAAAVIGNFQRMTRIADGTGIPLDEPVAMMSADIRDELGLDAFGSAERTPRVVWWKRAFARLLGPMILRRMARERQAG